MAFKRYAALLAGSALIGSLTFVQPAMAEENTEPTQCVRTVEETIKVAKAGTVRLPQNFGSIKSVSVADIPEAEYTRDTPNSRTLRFEVPENTPAGNYSVTITSNRGRTQTETLVVTQVDKVVSETITVDCATITVGNVTVTTGKTATVDAVIEDGASDLKFTAPEGLEVTVGDNGKTINIDATGAEVQTYTVDFTYQAEGNDERQNGSFQVDVVAPVVQTINDIKVTEGESKTVDLELKQGVTELEFTETGDLEIEFKDGKLTVDAKDAEANEYTVKFTYKANDEDKEGTFKVTVEKADEPGAPVVTIGDVTVTQGETETVTANVEEGATDLTLNAPEGIKATLGENNVITIDATDAEAKTYTVAFTYQADGETKNGSFKVTVEKKKDENASSKASSNFLGFFKGLSSK